MKELSRDQIDEKYYQWGGRSVNNHLHRNAEGLDVTLLLNPAFSAGGGVSAITTNAIDSINNARNL